MAPLALFVVLCLGFESSLGNSYTDRRAKNEAFIERLNNGMKLAKEYFGMDSAAMKAADFVIRAFKAPRPEPFMKQEQADKQKSPTPQAEPFGPLRNIVKLFGLEPTQISAVAVNAIIFVAQMITTFLNGGAGARLRPKANPVKPGDPSSWIIENKSKNLQNLITLAKNESLPDIIVDAIKDKDKPDETSCVQLLICKITPFVSRMQDTVFGIKDGRAEDLWDETGTRTSILYRHLPSRDEVNWQSAACEKRYPSCDLKN